MSLKDLFQVNKVLPPISNEQIAEEIESVEVLEAYVKEKDRVQFAVDYSEPVNFSIFGSAEKYYTDTVARIYEQYPYDGSKKEKLDWYNSSSLLDIWFYENAYPRTTGYAKFSPSGWSAPIGSQISGYGEPTTKEYVVIKGGPNTNSSTSLKGKFEDANNQNPKSNLYDTTTNRSSNLALDGDSGVTLEFWLSKDSFITSSTRKEVVFDLWNGEASSSVSYGRMTLELSGTTGSPFYLTLKSGSSGVTSLNLGSGITTSSVANGTWNHYAVTAKNNGSSLNVKLYINGQLNSETTTGTSVGNVTGSMVANIGALRTAPSGVTGVGLGWGKLSGSLDDFRFWKAERTAREIGRNWWTNIGGGTNTDDANTTLGFYYKFNEGITTDSTIDSIVLDYSGRISNGTWVGYSSASRNTGSAINEYTGKTLSTEEPDPIIYSIHPDVVDIISEYTTIGRGHDATNPNVMYYSFPNWIVEEDENGDLLNVTQIAASYLDTLYLQIKFLTTIKDQYSNIQIDEKPFPFSKSLLESMGIVAPSLFVDAKLMEEVLSRDEERNFEDKLNEVKNIIYQNIYSNLQSILKSKGTEKSVRNLLHCFGIDEELVKLAVYSNNDNYQITNNVSNTTIKKKSINLNDPDRFGSSIYQYKNASNINSYSYISGSASTQLDYIPYTFEAEVVFPKKLEKDHESYFETSFLTSSIFGGHTAVANPDDYTWASPDYFGFNVSAVREEVESKNVKFILTVPNLSLILTSSLYTDVYNNEKWNLAVRIKPDKFENANIVSGTTNTTYTIELQGVNSDGGVVVNEFSVSSSFSNANGRNFVRAAKRLYFGAERINFTGSVSLYSDIKLLTFRAWSSYLTSEEIKNHSYNTDNYGVNSLTNNYYLKQNTFNNISIPKIDTLLLDWQFDEVTGSNSGSGVPNTNDGYFLVNDATSGSLSYSKYNTVFNNLKKYQYVGKGDFFLQNDNSIVDTQYIFSSKLNHFEDIKSSDLINILSTEEQVLFTRQTRPITYFFSFEKSMYRTISEQMLNMFGTILDFNNLVGDPVNKYRKEYKALGKLRQMFFEKVQNTPDLDKYLDFYKWIDSAVGKFLLQLVPASADTSDGLLNVIESHALERNKHQYKFPTIEFKQPELIKGFDGINKHLYNWKYGHRPLNNKESSNNLYWNERAERNTVPLSSSNSGVNNTRTKILDAKTSALNRNFTTVQKLSISQIKPIKGGTNFEQNKNLDFVKIATSPHGPLDADDLIQPPANYLFVGVENTSSLLKSKDETNPLEKVKYFFTTIHGRDYLSSSLSPYEVLNSKVAIPANFISASIEGGYHKQIAEQFMSGVNIVNIHNDTYGSSNEIPMQSPFTNQWVGGNQSRHIPINDGNDNYLNRREAWKLLLGLGVGQTGSISNYQAAFGFVGADYPHPEGNEFEPGYPVVDHKRATMLREEVAKRPVNIKNIKSTTDLNNLGNFIKNYEVVHTTGRTSGKAFLSVENPPTSSELFGIVRTEPTFEGKRTNFELTDRQKTESVIGNRFSSPGDYRTLSRGYLNALIEEYSPYNAIPFRNRQVIGDGRRNSDVLNNDEERYAEIVSGAETNDLNSLFAKASSFSGYQSGSNTIASLHKVNRNTLYTIDISGTQTYITKDFDNGFISHQIPQKDSGYSWITASLSGNVEDGNLAFFGHVLNQFTIPSGNTSTDSAIDFISASVIGLETNNVPVDFVGLNTNIVDQITFYTTLGSTTLSNYKGGLVSSITNTPDVFNSIQLNRNGPYGYSSFKQTRNSYHPVVRKQNNDNYVSLNTDKKTFVISKEPVVYYNLPDEIYFTNTQTSKSFEAEYSYDNLLQNFETPSLFNAVTTTKNETFYEKATKFFLNNLNYKFTKLVKNKRIFPTANRATLKDVRQRSRYYFYNWKENRTDRNISTGFNSTYPAPIYAPFRNERGSIVYLSQYGTQSVWTMDGQTALFDFAPHDSLPFDSREGTLQNQQTFMHNQPNGYSNEYNPSSVIEIRPQPRYHLPHFDRNQNSVLCASSFTTSLTKILGTSSAQGGLGVMSIPWDTPNHPSATLGPYFSSYEKWYEPLQRIGKDYSLIPEYVISDDEVISRILKGDYRSSTSNRLIITGSNIDLISSNFALFSLTDKLENIDNIKKDLSNVTKTVKISLDCEGLLKFNAKPELYPQIRTVKIAERFTNSIYPFVSVWTASNPEIQFTVNQDTQLNNQIASAGIRNLLVPMFAPGILYNTIKAGVAVDFPILTQSLNVAEYKAYGNANSTTVNNDVNFTSSYYLNNDYFDSRIPFEALVEPESYLRRSIIDLVPYPSASLNFTASWTGDYRDNKYKLSMNNFLAETIDFFAPEGKLTTIFSKPESEFKQVQPGTEYRALLKIFKTSEKNNLSSYLYAGSGSIQNTIYVRPQYTTGATETITMYSRPSAFGPPCGCANYYGTQSVGQDPKESVVPYTYAPFTPPYYDGASWALITYRPTGSVPYIPTLKEIFNNSTVKYIRFEETLPQTGNNFEFSSSYPVSGTMRFKDNAANINAMQLSASVNIFNYLNVQELLLNTSDASTTEAQGVVWAIQSKFETPILTFNKDDTGYSSSINENLPLRTYGMWHQYGVLPDTGKGVYLQISDVPQDYTRFGVETIYKDAASIVTRNSETTGSLADVVGFTKTPIKMGQVATEKEIKEAVLCIPYIIQENKKKYIKLNDKAVKYIQKEFFGIKLDIEAVEQNNAISVSQTIKDQINKLKDYVLPPSFDFLNNIDIEPISMYVFEFKYNLTQEDLIKIWQGIQPSIADKIEKQKITISHELSEEELLSIDNLTENLKWLVFKVKKKAKTNYYSKLVQSAQEKNKNKINTLLKLGRTPRASGLSSKDNELLYSYNWPYDYFSLVELAKVNVSVEFDGNEKVVETISDDTIFVVNENNKPFETPVIIQEQQTEVPVSLEPVPLVIPRRRFKKVTDQIKRPPKVEEFDIPQKLKTPKNIESLVGNRIKEQVTEEKIVTTKIESLVVSPTLKQRNTKKDEKPVISTIEKQTNDITSSIVEKQQIKEINKKQNKQTINEEQKKPVSNKPVEEMSKNITKEIGGLNKPKTTGRGKR